MAQKRFGPTLDAGVVVIEKESEKTIVPAQLGSTAYVGILERGPVGELITAVGKKDLLAKTGGLIPDSLLPDAAQDFWDHSQGAGVLFLYRVTDGKEVKATLILYDRKAGKNAVITVDAKNGGSWAGKRDTYVVDLAAVPGDITAETTIDLPVGFHPIQKDQFKNGTLISTETGNSYPIIGNDASDGTTKTELRLASDQTLQTDFASGTDVEFIIELESIDVWGREKHLAVEILDGQLNPSTEWGMKVYVNDELVKTWPDLSSDPNSSRYFVDLINDDPTNYYVAVTDLWVGSITTAVRPANFYTVVADTEIAAKQLDLATVIPVVTTAFTGGASTIAAFTYGAKVTPDTYTITYNGTTWDVVSTGKQANHTFPAASGGVPYVADNPYSFGFTITEAAPISGDVFTVTLLPLEADEAIGGRIFFPNEAWAPGQGFFITDNEEDTVDITTGDLTNGGTISGNITVRLQYQQQLTAGYDGIATVDELDFSPAFDVNISPFNDTADGGYGLIKFASPGITELISSSISSVDKAQVVERAGKDYAETRNHQYRLEIPKTATDEIVVKNYVQNVVGKSDHEKVCFHGYAKVSDPVLTDRLKTVPTVGMFHGREAKVAKDFDGYHKVAAGIDVTLPRIRELLTGDTKLNGEIINPAGIQRIEKKSGNFVIWGARIPAVDTAFKFSQHRELLSYYEQVLVQSFDFIIFAINDPIEQPALVAALQSFFYPEWVKRAVRGDTFEDAVQIKIDDENNTDATRAAGDLNADITLRLADTVERFIITISKAGVFDSSAAA